MLTTCGQSCPRCHQHHLSQWRPARQSDHYEQNFIEIFSNTFTCLLDRGSPCVRRIKAWLLCYAEARHGDMNRRGGWSELIQRDTEWSRWTVAGVPESTALLAGGVSVATRSNGYISQSSQTRIFGPPFRVMEKENPGLQGQDELWCRKSKRCCSI